MPTKRKTRGARSRTVSENMTDDSGPQPPPKKRGRRRTKENDTIWVDDDTLPSDDKPTLILSFSGSDDSDDSDYVPEQDEDSELEEGFIQYLLEKYVGKTEAEIQPEPKVTRSSKKTETMPIKLTKSEETYYKNQPAAKRRELMHLMNRVSSLVLDEGETPHKFRVLQLPISDYVKSSVIKKISTIAEISGDGGDGHKLRSWLDAFMRIPFGKTVPLPIQLKDGQEKCTNFMIESRKKMDKHIYGMEPAKLQIMQIIAQWIVNPSSVGNVIALQGPMGVGKTSFARNAIAEVLQRPFEFFTLGGASDIANFIGHSYTYEGSLWGRIADCLMHAGTMNPVMYFDELDKISETPQGEEIVSMMIHMTDRSQNTQFHDRYFAGVDFDLSQCLFVFSFNDIEKVHPILRDRMTVIHCGGYSEKDKTIILKEYIWPQILERLYFNKTDVILTDSAIKFIIDEYSKDEKGVRTLIRTMESMMTRLNMLRVAKHESMKEYKFYMDVVFPLTINDSIVKVLLTDFAKKDADTWKGMYT
uniref:ATPase AAA-type core domain-containing protein n=1 Tax=viral metagenome TaxID=1070528 RepID=A0A6C0JP29_9ZZZZ